MPSKTKPPARAALPASYEEALQELEALTTRLESGMVPLGELLQGHQRGTALLQYCQQQLQAVEQQVNFVEVSATEQIEGGTSMQTTDVAGKGAVA